jgi:subtilisin family serine protease
MIVPIELRLRIVRSGVVLAFLYGGLALAGDGETESREVLIKFVPGGHALQSERLSAPLPKETLSNRLLQATIDLRLESLEKAFPHFQARDTLGVARTGEVVRLSNWSDVYVLRFPTHAAALEFVARTNGDPTVGYAEINGTEALDGAVYPNDPEFRSGSQWSHWNYGQGGGAVGADVDAPQSWGITKGANGLLIGVVDGGIDRDPEDLQGRVQGSPVVGDGHGTNVAGIIGAISDNGKGVAGLHWYPILHSETLGNDDGTALAVRNVGSAGAVVVNNSWHVAPPGRWSGIVREAFADLYKLNRVAVATMGNTSSYLVQYPAGFPGVIAVGNVTREDLRWPTSTMGPNIDLAAPGTDIVTTGLGESSYPHVTGTSFAAPHVSAAASLLLSHNPSLYNDDIEQILRRSADDLPPSGWDTATGYGRLNIRRALELVSPPNNITHSVMSPGLGSIVSSSGWFEMKFYGVPGLTDGREYVVRRHEVHASVIFLPPYPPPGSLMGWGRGVGTVGFNTEEPNFGVGWCEPVAFSSGGATFRTYVYEVKYFGLPIGYFPCTPSQVQPAFTTLRVAPTPDLSTSFFVPEAGTTASPSVGTEATQFFRVGPNNDGGSSLPNHARIRVILKDASGAAVAGVPSRANICQPQRGDAGARVRRRRRRFGRCQFSVEPGAALPRRSLLER